MNSRALAVFGLGAALVGATYPLALLGQFGTDVVHGDAEIVRELSYGPHRALAAKLVQGWIGSLVWAAGFWLVIEVLGRAVPRLYVPATFVLAAAVLGISFAGLAPIPPIFGWLLMAALILQRVHAFVRSRLLHREVACAS